MTTAPYVYRISSVLRVVDGDSFWANLDVGFRQTLLVNIRVAGIDCPERRQGSPFERRKAAEAHDATAHWLDPASADVDGTYWVRTMPDPDSFGRWLGQVWWESDKHTLFLTNHLMVGDLATRWPTRWHQTYDPDRNLP